VVGEPVDRTLGVGVGGEGGDGPSCRSGQGVGTTGGPGVDRCAPSRSGRIRVASGGRGHDSLPDQTGPTRWPWPRRPGRARARIRRRRSRHRRRTTAESPTVPPAGIEVDGGPQIARRPRGGPPHRAPPRSPSGPAAAIGRSADAGSTLGWAVLPMDGSTRARCHEPWRAADGGTVTVRPGDRCQRGLHRPTRRGGDAMTVHESRTPWLVGTATG
jgi:hypothetical protein